MKLLSKERPNEKPQIGDLVVRRTRGGEYYTSKLVDLRWRGRNKIIATIEYSNRGYLNPRTGRSYVPTQKCNYLQLTKVRKDYWYEALWAKMRLKIKRKKGLCIRQQR